MSSKAPQQSEEWQLRRVHGVIRRFRKGPDGQKRFLGQQPDEVIRLIVREHPIFYVSAIVPSILALALVVAVVWLNAAASQVGPILPMLNIIAIVVFLCALVYTGYKLFELWWVNVDVITNKRILTWRGLLKPTRDQTTLDKVQQVAIDQDSITSMFFSYGSVHIYLAGGKGLRLEKIPRPKKVRDAVEGVWQDFKTSAPKKPAAPPPEDNELATVVTNLGANKALEKLPDADKRYEHRRSPVKMRRPLRPFGGPLRLECEVHYDADEYSVMYVQRSKWVLAIKLALPVFLLIASLVGAVTARTIFAFFAVAFVVLLVVVGLTIINYVDDVFILSNKRIIDIERKLVIFYEQHVTTTYDKINKIEVKMRNIFEVALDVGDLFIETQGNNPNITMRHVAHPFDLQDKIYQIKGTKEKNDKIKGENERKNELKDWFNTVLGTLEKKMVNRGVPNLQSLDLWEAAERASSIGMRVVPVGESAEYPGVAPGKIVSQVPSPGTLLQHDPNNPAEKPQIQVVLSRRP